VNLTPDQKGVLAFVGVLAVLILYMAAHAHFAY
jgi:hypothetical protein